MQLSYSSSYYTVYYGYRIYIARKVEHGQINTSSIAWLQSNLSTRHFVERKEKK